MNIKLFGIIIITALLASCSVVNKNGYYQSRKYNPSLVKLKKAKPESVKEKTVANKTYSELSELENEIAKANNNVPLNPEIYSVYEETNTTINPNAIADIKVTKTALTKALVRHKIPQSVQKNIKQKTQNPTRIQEDNPPKEEPILAYISLGFVAVTLVLAAAAISAPGIGLLSIASMVLGFIAHKQLKENPDGFYNKWAITLAYVFAWINLALVILGVLYILLLIALQL